MDRTMQEPPLILEKEANTKETKLKKDSPNPLYSTERIVERVKKYAEYEEAKADFMYHVCRLHDAKIMSGIELIGNVAEEFEDELHKYRVFIEKQKDMSRKIGG